MNVVLHFISGLPRSGSTLLSSLLRQPPRISAGITSPFGHLFNAMMRETSMRREDAAFVDDEVRERLLRAVCDAGHPDDQPHEVVFDAKRLWTTKLHILAEMFPQAQAICCVRSPAWIVGSVETPIRADMFELSGIFGFEAGGTIYSRAEALTGPGGMVGFPLDALREAVHGPHADRLMLVRYDTLGARPLDLLASIHDFIDQPMGAHDPQNIAPSQDMYELDRRFGTPGLHAVRGRAEPKLRKTLPPPEPFILHDNKSFRRDLAALPAGLRIP